MTQNAGRVTQLLVAVRAGDRDANGQLMEVLHAELRRLARRYMRGERPNHTLQPTALVNEAYIRLLAKDSPDWQNRAHFMAHAARAMRQILVDHARANRTDKRGGKQLKVSIEGARSGADMRVIEALAAPARPAEVIALDEALEELGRLDARQAQIVELRSFGGMSDSEIADLLGISTRTVGRESQTARLWLRRHMESQGGP